MTLVANSTSTMTTATLSVDLTSGSFPGGKLSLRCVADVFAVTTVTKELWLDEDRPRLASVLGTRDSAGTYVRLNTSTMFPS